VTYTKPRFTRPEVNWAGRAILDSAPSPYDLSKSLDIVNNWRASHSYPLLLFRLGIVVRLKKWGPSSSIVAQRIKRLSSIRLKLRLQPTMKLSQMQDIGGCRAIVSTTRRVLALQRSYKESRQAHVLVHEDDYIQNPKPSGYRSVHLVYKFSSKTRPEYNDLKIELQLRSKLQHAWATAVETVGTLIEEPLKSSIGTADWLRFFSLMGAELALREGTPQVPDTPSSIDELIAKIRDLAESLQVERVLSGYGAAIEKISRGERQAPYYLLELRPSQGLEGKGVVTVTGFELNQLEEANAKYLEVEQTLTGPGDQAVLVRVESLTALPSAYPNYFLDTRLFLDEVRNALNPPRSTKGRNGVDGI
jgi:hypothetical protein